MLNKDLYAFKDFNATESTSGGAFPYFANLFFKKYEKAKLYGVKYDSDFNIVFDCIDSFEQINCFKGSKYARAKLNDCFNKIRADLESGYHVMFCGLPCQVYSLKIYLKDNHFFDNLFTIDLVCHGSPNTQFWDDYKSLLERKYGKMQQYAFRFGKRNKSRGFFKKKGLVINDKNMQSYMELFSKNLILDKCCFNCIHKNANLIRPGDITIGDFWGANYCFKNNRLHHKTSLIMFNTPRTFELIKQLTISANKELFFMRCESNDWILFNKNIFQQTPMPKLYENFWLIYKNDGIEDSLVYGKKTIVQRIKQQIVYLIDFLNLKLFILKHFSKEKKNEIHL